jgi:16S rRNA (guanine527-N7)-methyltransferase
VDPDLKRQAGHLLGWMVDDLRWPKLAHYLARVRGAGVPLVSKRDRERLVERHLIPSLEALPFIAEEGRLMDIGSGGGFPALPLAFARPGVRVVCVESNSRKAAFLRRVSRETELENVQIVESRVENVGVDFDHTADYVTARAVGDLRELLIQTARFLRPSRRWIIWKGRDWRRERNLSEWRVKLVEERGLSDGSELLVLIPTNPRNLP